MQDYTYEFVASSDPHSRVVIRVRASFICDGASIWRVFWTLAGVRLGGRIRAAAVVHDWIYRWNGAPALCGTWFTRRRADKLFRRIMREAGMERRRIWLCYWAVRLGGWHAWNKWQRVINETRHDDDNGKPRKLSS
jgi:hypothetical protein